MKSQIIKKYFVLLPSQYPRVKSLESFLETQMVLYYKTFPKNPVSKSEPFNRKEGCKVGSVRADHDQGEEPPSRCNSTT